MWEAESVGWSALGDPQEELSRYVLAVTVSLVEVHDEFKTRAYPWEGALDLVGEQEAPDSAYHLSHVHKVPVKGVLEVVEETSRVALVCAGEENVAVFSSRTSCSGGNAVPVKSPSREPWVPYAGEAHRVTRGRYGEGPDPEPSPRERCPLPGVQMEVVRGPFNAQGVEHGFKVHWEDGVDHLLDQVNRQVGAAMPDVPAE